jgi:hypothetical protein
MVTGRRLVPRAPNPEGRLFIPMRCNRRSLGLHVIRRQATIDSGNGSGSLQGASSQGRRLTLGRRDPSGASEPQGLPYRVERHEVVALACQPLGELAGARTQSALRPLAEAAPTWGYIRPTVSQSTVR